MTAMTAALHAVNLRSSRRRSAPVKAFRSKVMALWYCAVTLAAVFTINWAYQVFRKPGELLAPFSAAFSKSPEATWQSYGSLFQKHSTEILSPEFLAALAQVESSGNPLAGTYWQWQWSWNPLEIYRPASSALGMYQITDGTFAEARRYCLRNQQVISEGPWHDLGSCWFNSFYLRTLPSHASELTAAHLHRSVITTLAAHGTPRASLAQKQRLAAVIHLCGKQRGARFVRRDFRVTPAERCGDHSLSGYLKKVELMKKRFARLRKSSLP